MKKNTLKPRIIAVLIPNDSDTTQQAHIAAAFIQINQLVSKGYRLQSPDCTPLNDNSGLWVSWSLLPPPLLKAA
jgi:hypothetical protein